MFRRTAPANNGLIFAVCFQGQNRKRGARIVPTSLSILREINSFSPPGGYTSLYAGGSDFCKNVLKAVAMPSMQRRSYL